MYDNEESEEGHGTLNRDDEDGYFDDESAEVVISSLRLGDDQGSMFTNSNWFAFQDERVGDDVPSSATSPFEQMDESNLNGTLNGNNSSDDEVVIGEDEELVGNKNSNNGTSISNPNPFIGDTLINDNSEEISAPVDEGLFADRARPEWGESGPVSGSGMNPFLDYKNTPSASDSSSLADHSPDSSQKVELGGSEKAMDQALKEGIVGEAGPLKKQVALNEPGKESPDQNGSELSDFNDTNYWRVDQEVSVSE